LATKRRPQKLANFIDRLTAPQDLLFWPTLYMTTVHQRRTGSTDGQAIYIGITRPRNSMARVSRNPSKCSWNARQRW